MKLCFQIKVTTQDLHKTLKEYCKQEYQDYNKKKYIILKLAYKNVILFHHFYYHKNIS